MGKTASMALLAVYWAKPGKEIYLISFSTRKSSCVNGRGIPTAAYQVLHVLSCPGGGGGVPELGYPRGWWGYPILAILTCPGSTPWQRYLCWEYPHPDLAGVPSQLDLIGVPPSGPDWRTPPSGPSRGSPPPEVWTN